MRLNLKIAVISVAALAATAAYAADNFWPKGAKVSFVAPKNGAQVTSPVKIVMSVEGVKLVPAGKPEAGSGHHHIYIDAAAPSGPATALAIPADDNHKHFGKAQTETELALSPGKHTLQLVFGDGAHVPHDPPLVSKKITITVK
jgi:hypothetical protein